MEAQQKRTNRPFEKIARVFLVAVCVTAGAVYLHHFIGIRTEQAHAQNQKQLWTCGMHPQVIKDEPGTCPICHMKLTPLEVEAESAETVSAEKKIKYWWDPMIGPDSISDKPGKSSMGMDLVPVYEDKVSGGKTVTIDPVVVQNMGVRFAAVKSGPVRRNIRAVGFLKEAEPNVHDINLRVSGWIEKIYADTEGAEVKKGEPLFELYSPEVQVAVAELIAAKKAASSRATDFLSKETTKILVDSSRQKLMQWGLSNAQVQKLSSLDQPPRTIPFVSPLTGHVTEKNIVQGASVKAGERALRIVDHSTLWLDSQLYEQDLPFIHLGQDVSATVEAMPGKVLDGKIIFLHPHVDPVTRTTTVRISLPNPKMILRPGMYATAEIVAQLEGGNILAPSEAIIDAGTRKVVFVSLGNGRFEPREVKTGVSAEDGMTVVLEGLVSGETIVTSGQFLLDAESRMKQAIQKHLDQKLKEESPKQTVPAGAPMSEMMHSNASVSGEIDQQKPGGDGKLQPGPDVDAVYVAYLNLSEALGETAEVQNRKVQAALDLNPLMKAAQILTELSAGPNQILPGQVLKAARAMDGKMLDEQRKLFAPLSNSVIQMIQVCPPSKAFGRQLFVAHCPMAFGTGADWIQTDTQIKNPFYSSEMKTCGEIKQTIATAGVQ